jgi:C1A family cysteine protease
MTKRVLNWHPSVADHRTLKYTAVKRQTLIPASVDLRKLCPPVYDQGDIGSCSGNALAGALEFLENMALASQMPVGEAPEEFSSTFTPVSRLFIYWNERAIEGTTSHDAGATSLRDGCDALFQKGVCRETTWPYSDSLLLVCPHSEAYGEAWHHKLDAYYQLDTLNDMRNCLALGYPFTLGIPVYDSFMSDEVAQTGQIPMPGPTESLQGGHAVLIVGYDDRDQTFLLRNSWGTDWGMQGYAKIPYAYVTMLGDDFFTLRLKPTRLVPPTSEVEHVDLP